MAPNPDARYFDGWSAAATPVTLATTPAGLRITAPSGHTLDTWSLRAITAETTPGGTTLRRRGTFERIVLATTDLPPGLAPPRRSPRLLPAALAFTALAVALAFAIHRGPDLLAPLVPTAWEAPLGNATARLLTQPGTCTTPPAQAALDRLAAILATQGAIPTPIRVTVVDSPVRNALALPGNRMILMRGLITSASDGDELAGVMAHEAGHIAHHDPAKALLRAFGLQALATLLGWNGSTAGTAAEHLVTLAYGRQAEAAADAFAIDILRASHLHADGLNRFFAALSTGPTLPAFLSDHPPAAERHAATIVPQDPASNPAFTPGEWIAIQSVCGPAH